MRSSPLLVLLIAGFIASLSTGCASRKETRKDLTVFMPGVERAALLHELGTPVSTTPSRDGHTVDIFTFVQGTAESKNPPRPVEPERAEATQAMVLLGQLPYSPTRILTGKKITMQVNYDAEERVRDVVLLRLE